MPMSRIPTHLERITPRMELVKSACSARLSGLGLHRVECPAMECSFRNTLPHETRRANSRTWDRERSSPGASVVNGEGRT